MINPEIKQARKRTWKINQLERDTRLRSKNKDNKILRWISKWVDKKFLFIYAGFKIYEVNGEWIRNNLYAWFRIGGHGRVHLFIPNDEIWIEENHGTPTYMARTIIHEISEFKAMEKLPFYHAHLKALCAELSNLKKLNKIIKLLRERI